ncbi:OmpH family outer membrane protein [Desulfobacula phenolica]|uniref:Periplasmic chaperone for outer membrane proteins Skp n=1 Tax=Desulfobacula phenolica TaxID=90732 RepID=A0A1H2K276_9BACT|nr:OmpH family outer membrane protein [Desulfobacula phenolica]SDU62789.1 periplasmic chaperone for outer membrane proteins Skp [Desulfobacula phenolica]
MKRAVIILSMILFFGFIPEAFCADIAKIGVVDFQKILSESSAGKIIQKQITGKGAELQKKLQDEKNQLDEMQKAFERESLVLSPEKQKEKQREFRIRVNDFKKMQDDFSKEFKRLEMNSLNKIQKEVFEITDEIGKEEGYLLILEKKTAGVIYHPTQLDITDQVIKKYNLKMSKTN